MTQPSDERPGTPPWPRQPNPGGYPPPPPQYPGFGYPPRAPKNGLGIAALAIGILAVLLCLLPVGLGIVLGICAVVMGSFARSRIRRGEANNNGVAVAGIVLGIVAIVVGVAVPAYFAISYEQCRSNAHGRAELAHC